MNSVEVFRVTRDEKGPTIALSILHVVLMIANKQSYILKPVFFTINLGVIPISENSVDEKYGVLEI